MLHIVVSYIVVVAVVFVVLVEVVVVMVVMVVMVCMTRCCFFFFLQLMEEATMMASFIVSGVTNDSSPIIFSGVDPFAAYVVRGWCVSDAGIGMPTGPWGPFQSGVRVFSTICLSFRWGLDISWLM